MDPWAEIMGLWAVIMDVWAMMVAEITAEPKWWAIIGLGLDLVGGVLVALTTWMRVIVNVPWGGPAEEPPEGLRKRRRIVVSGALLLTAGFALQMWSNTLQIPG